MRTSLSLLAVITMMPVGLGVARSSPEPEAAPAIACRTLEVHTDAKLGVMIVVFHQRDDRDRDRVSALLRGHDGAVVEVRTSGGATHPATVMRLKSCFGRGLLVLPADSTALAEKDEFLLVEPTTEPH